MEKNNQNTNAFKGLMDWVLNKKKLILLDSFGEAAILILVLMFLAYFILSFTGMSALNYLVVFFPFLVVPFTFLILYVKYYLEKGGVEK